MIKSPGGVTRTFELRVRKNVKPVTSEGLAYIFVKMLAGPLQGVSEPQGCRVFVNGYNSF